jgi:FtsP/CotA-like multicopper oxidase with cupredoxin domain
MGLSRRNILKLVLGSLGTLGLASLWKELQSETTVHIPPIPTESLSDIGLFNPMTMLRDFNYGTIKQENGQTVREFEITAHTDTLKLNSVINYVTWNYDHRVPGMTLRAKYRDRVRVIFHNQGGHSHTMHFHGFHPAEADGIKPVRHGETTVYEFIAEPYGVHLYHCHVAPVTRHVGKGMYGLFIIDPPKPRPPADEMVLVMGGYDLEDDGTNELYAFNGIPDYYQKHPIQIYQNQLIRLYVLNMIEHNAAVTFHLHANFFDVYRTGMTLTPQEKADVITMGTAERHILEFAYPYPGKYMFHPHQDEVAESGCMGLFEVIADLPTA